MSSTNGPYPGPPPAPQQHQPRWAWWVIGIVIPLVGILVTVLVSRPGARDDKSDARPLPTRSSATAKDGAPQAPADRPTDEAEDTGGAQDTEAARPVFGPKEIQADTTNSGSYIDFDGTEPLVVASSTIEGADLIIGAPTGGTPTLFVPDSQQTLAPLAGSGDVPTAQECTDSVGRNATYTLEATRGGRFCLETDEGRTVYLKVITNPSAGPARLQVAVWGPPGA
jgi:hypothetical protein